VRIICEIALDRRARGVLLCSRSNMNEQGSSDGVQSGKQDRDFPTQEPITESEAKSLVAGFYRSLRAETVVRISNGEARILFPFRDRQCYPVEIILRRVGGRYLLDDAGTTFIHLDHDVGCARSPRFLRAIMLLAKSYGVDFDGTMLSATSEPERVVRRTRDMLEAILAVNSIV